MPEIITEEQVDSFLIPPKALIVNATSLGLSPADPAPVSLPKTRKNIFVYDMIYNPPQTSLLEEAKSLGLPHANGLGMLVGQAAKSLEIWSGANVPISAMEGAAMKLFLPLFRERASFVSRIYGLLGTGCGACLGSFLNVCASRIPVGISLVRPPSRCPACQKKFPFS